MRCKLEFFQSLNPVLLSRINNQQIAALQNHYSTLQDRLKLEKAGRIVKQKMDSLKEQVKKLRTDNEERKNQDRNFRRNHQHPRIPDIPGGPTPSVCDQTQDSLLTEIVRGINSPREDNLINTTAIMNESGIQNSEASQVSDQNIEFLGRNNQISFEESAMNDDSMNASPCSRFAADHPFFLRIFSELFLGGSGENGLDESQNAERKQQIDDQQNKVVSNRGNKSRNVGRRKTAEKIVDDISYIDEDGGHDIYSDVVKILDQEQKKMTDQEKQQSQSSSYKIFKNNKISEAVNEGQITQSTDQECQQFFANNFFTPSEKIRNMQIQIQLDRRQNMAIQQAQLQEQEINSNQFNGFHGALKGYASIEEEIEDSMNLTIQGLGQIMRDGGQVGQQKQQRQQLFIADEDEEEKQILIQTDSMIQSELQDRVNQQSSELIFSPRIPQVSNIASIEAPLTPTTQRKNVLNTLIYKQQYNVFNNSQRQISHVQDLKQQSFLKDFNSKQAEDLYHNQPVRSRIISNGKTNQKKVFFKYPNGPTIDRSPTTDKQKPKQKVLKNKKFFNNIMQQKKNNYLKNQTSDIKHEKEVVEIVGTGNKNGIYQCRPHHSSQRQSSRGNKVKQIIKQGLAPDHRQIIQKSLKGSKLNSNNSSTNSSSALGKATKIMPSRLGGVSLNQSGIMLTSPSNKVANIISMPVSSKNTKFQQFSKSANNSQQSSTKDLQQSQYRNVQINNTYLNNPNYSNNTSNNDLNTSAIVYGNQSVYSNSNSKQIFSNMQSNTNIGSFRSTKSSLSKGTGLKQTITAKNNGTINKMKKTIKQLAQHTMRKQPSNGVMPSSHSNFGQSQLKFDGSQPYNIDQRMLQHTPPPPPPGSKNQSSKLLESALSNNATTATLSKMPGKYAQVSSKKLNNFLTGEHNKYMNIDGAKNMIHPQTPKGQTTFPKFNISAVGGSANKKQGLKGKNSSSQVFCTKKN